jgi:hypothetical protein
MNSQLPLFDVEDYAHVAPIGEPLTGTGAPPSYELDHFDQPALDRILPGHYGSRLDLRRRRVRPYEPAVVVRGTGDDVECLEMPWGLPAPRSLHVPATSMWSGWWSQVRLEPQERRCIVMASSFAARRHSEGDPIWARGSSHQPGLLYLAGLCRITSDGPALTLLLRPASRPLARIAEFMPVMLAEDDVWSWFNGPRWLLPLRLGLPRRRPVVAFTTSAGEAVLP